MSSERIPGQIVKIPVQQGQFVYGCNLKHAAVAVYDTYGKGQLPLSEIINQKVIFTVTVFDKGFAKWEKIGIVPLEQERLYGPNKFVQDVWILANIRILDSLGNERQASFEEVQGLERASVWDYNQVEQRVRDYYDNKTNWIVEFKRPKPPTMPHFRPTEKHIPEPGAIKQIDLGDKTYVYGRELANNFLSVYDSRTTDGVPPPNVTELPVLFTVSISLSARLGWPKVAFVPLKPNELPLPDRYMMEGEAGDEIKIYDGNLVARPATPEEIVGLEPAVMWDNYHIVNRLHAYYAGKPWRF
jgi:hypothetical protein